MARFKDIQRGWTTGFGEVQTQKTLVDNLVNNWDALSPDGADLVDAGEGSTLLGAERNPEFWIERLVVHYEPYAIPTALNTANFVDAFFGLAIFGTEIARKDDIPLSMTTDPLWEEIPRGNEGYVRMLTCRPHRCVVRGLGTSGEPDTIQWMRENYFYMFDVKNLFLRKGETVVFWLSQTGAEDDFFPWTTSDIAGACWMSQALVRKKKGR